MNETCLAVKLIFTTRRFVLASTSRGDDDNKT